MSKQKASLKDYLLTKKHLSPILLDRLLESDLIKLKEGNLTCRHYDLSGEIVGQINPFAADSSKVQGYFNFSQGSGDLTRIVLTSDPIEAMSAATLSTRTNEKNFFVSPQGDVTLGIDRSSYCDFRNVGGINRIRAGNYPSLAKAIVNTNLKYNQ
ncbi:MAG: hypothetical protein ACFBSE_18600 [Prochloraceae cyanobacterium]